MSVSAYGAQLEEKSDHCQTEGERECQTVETRHLSPTHSHGDNVEVKEK